MNKYKFIFWIGLISVMYGCEKHDFLADRVTTGQQTSSTYWELSSTTISAGNNVPFTVQFFNAEGVPIDRMEVWYSEEEHKAMSISCPNLVTEYVKSFSSSEVVHINQKKVGYEFSESLWDNDKRNYLFNSSFPTSNSLKPVSWTNVADFDMEKFNSLFPATFATEFKAELYTELEAKTKYSDLRKLVLSMEVMDEEELLSYTDSTFNDNSQSWEYWIKDSSKSAVKAKYDAIEFKDLIYDAANSIYKVSYEKNFTLDACFKVIDKNGNTGVSESKTITLN